MPDSPGLTGRLAAGFAADDAADGEAAGGVATVAVPTGGSTIGGAIKDAASAGGATAAGTSVAITVSAALRVMATMLMRRLIGLKGSSFTNKADEAKPTTRDIFSSG